MRRAVAAVVLSASIAAVTACTPEQRAWWTAKVTEARAAGVSCPEAAPALDALGLPEHFHTVIWRESNCNPFAVNSSSGALGLTQIMPFWLDALCPAGIACTEADLLDPWKNLEAAAFVFAAQGPSAWSQTW
jgi:soluble lytic murein transglycosylase-like protein